MRFINDFKVYDTELSEEICTGSIKIRVEYKLFDMVTYLTREATLYRSCKGTYFYVYKGDYDSYYMRLTTESEAKSFIAHNNYPKYVELYGEMEEG